MAKHCLGCGLDKDVSEFRRKRTQGDGFTARCKECMAGSNRPYHLGRRHNLAPDQYLALLNAQGGRCANPRCRTAEPGVYGRFQVDHDHACCPGAQSCGKCVRGLLCGGCNRGLGCFNDSTERLLGAVEYLQPPTFPAGVSMGLL